MATYQECLRGLIEEGKIRESELGSIVIRVGLPNPRAKALNSQFSWQKENGKWVVHVPTKEDGQLLLGELRGFALLDPKPKSKK